MKKLYNLWKTNEEIVFDTKGIGPIIVNTLRHIMIAEIPILAIETVIINYNKSTNFLVDYQ